MKRLSVFLIILTNFTACNYNKPVNNNQQQPKKKDIVVPVFNEDSAYAYLVRQVSFGPRVPETEAHAKCAEWLIDFFNEMADTVYVQNFRSRIFNGKGIDGKNIIASFNPQAKKRIILASHWDSRPFADHDPDSTNWNTPIDGANDGASGVAIIMETARILKANPLEFGIDMILFDLEDYGAPQYMNVMDNDDWALGSQYWSKNNHVSNYRAYFGILLDMVGAPNPNFPKEYYSQQYASWVINNVWKTAEELGYGEYFSNETGNPINDDHIYMNNYGHIPTIDIIHLENDSENSTFYPYWHTLEDNMEHIDVRTLKMVGTVVLHVIYKN